MKLTLCFACRGFYDAKLRSCPECATEDERRVLNPALVNARWSSNLNAHAEHAVKHG